ncbi:MAG: hydrolase [Oscillospiraceae bacterium]|nr:hydrolase [Oscillospiraceae bacterium]
MAFIPTTEQAAALLAKYNSEPFHLQHGEVVSGVMGFFAQTRDPGREDYWRAVGMLHDIDFGLYPESHCVKGAEILREEQIDEGVIRSAMSHGWGMTGTPCEPVHIMEKVLFAVDELTGLIGAAALMRPSKSVSDMERKSVMKKFKDKKFAAGCSRETIQKGADMLGVTLEGLIDETILAMRSLEQGKPA